MKRQITKRLLAALVAAGMAVSLVACSAEPAKEDISTVSSGTPAVSATLDPMAKYDPGITLTTAMSISDGMQKYIDKEADVMTNNIWYNGYCDELGITIDYAWTTNPTQYAQKLNTQIAANDLPDVFGVDGNQLKMLVDNDMIADLTDVFAQYSAPFTKEVMELDQNVGIKQATFDGKLMALPQIYGNRSGGMMYWIRNDWLKNVGLEAPQSVDDILKIAEAFAKQDPDKDGKADTYGMALSKYILSYSYGMESIAAGYHAYDGWLDDGTGKLVAGIVQPEMKQTLATVAKMYQDGLIDKEFVVKDDAKICEDIVAGKIGLFSGADGQAFWPIPESMKADGADWGIYPLVSADDKPAKNIIGGSAGGYYVVSKDCKNPEAAVKLYNYWWAKDPAPSPDFDPNFHGQPDSNPDNPPKNAYWWSVMFATYPTQNLFIHQEAKKYWNDKDESVLENYWVNDNVTQHKAYLDGDMNFASTWMWSGPQGALNVVDTYNKNDAYLQSGYIGTATDAQTQYTATLDQLRLETFTKIVMGEKPIDEFDIFVEQWNKLGGIKITEEVNAAAKQ